MRRLPRHRRAPFPSGRTLALRALVSRALVAKRLGLTLSHRWSHMIPLGVMWLVCLNLVSETLIAQDYQRAQALESSAELPAFTASGSGASPADSTPSSPVPAPSPTATAQALRPEAPNPSQPPNTALATGQPAPARPPPPTLGPFHGISPQVLALLVDRPASWLDICSNKAGRQSTAGCHQVGLIPWNPWHRDGSIRYPNTGV